jgi:hypothetical protein
VEISGAWPCISTPPRNLCHLGWHTHPYLWDLSHPFLMFVLHSACVAPPPVALQVAVELMGLAAEQGADTWKGSTLNGKTFKLRGFSKLQVS